MRILVVAAHPDDEVYGMGGMIAKLTANKNEVYVLIVTDGSSTQYKGNIELLNKKKQEALIANKILGVKAVFFGDLPDMKLDTVAHVDVNEVIEKCIERIRPEIVYTHFYGDVNKDHQLVFESTLVAVRPTANQCVKELYCYQVPSATEWYPNLEHNIFIPNVFVDISEVFCKKEEAILAYETEIRNFPHQRSVEAVRKYNEAEGLKVGIGLAEAFMVMRKLS